MATADSFKLFDTYEELELHWATECHIARSACDKCNAEIPRDERTEHDCLKVLVFNRDEHHQYIEGHQKNIA